MSPSTSQELGDSLLKTIIQSDAVEAVAEIAEVTADQLINSTLLQDIPLVGTISKLAKAGQYIQEERFAKKIKKFLLSFQDVKPKEREKFESKLNEDPEYAQEVGEKIIVTLHQLDDLHKAEIVAKMFKAHLRDEITKDVFYRLIRAIEKAFYQDLIDLPNIDQTSRNYSMIYEQLAGTGLVKTQDYASVYEPQSIHPIPPKSPFPLVRESRKDLNQKVDFKLILTELGKIFCQLMKTEN